MKKLILFTLISLFAVSFTANAQNTYGEPEKIVVNKNDLTPSQIAKIESDAKIAQLEKKLETYGNWVGVGGEIGSAVKEGLNAVVDVADKFGNTNVGRFTLIMVAWKVIGKDAVRIVLGLLFILIFTIFTFRSYRQNFTTRKISLKSNGLKFWLPKEYTLVEPETYDGYQFVKFLYLLMIMGSFGITYAIMFA